MKSKKWPGSGKRLPSSEEHGHKIQRFNHEPFNLMTSYGEFEAKLAKTLK